jgi:hypothetical protein
MSLSSHQCTVSETGITIRGEGSTIRSGRMDELDLSLQFETEECTGAFWKSNYFWWRDNIDLRSYPAGVTTLDIVSSCPESLPMQIRTIVSL